MSGLRYLGLEMYRVPPLRSTLVPKRELRYVGISSHASYASHKGGKGTLLRLRPVPTT